jgi:uncharacterized metal-binding protein YceD (DUF177 family)
MINQPEFSRLLNVDRVPAEGATEEIAADAAECAALAKRFGVIAIHSLNAKIVAVPVSGGGLKLNAHIKAEVEQSCVVTLDNFALTVETQARRIYVPGGSRAANENEDETDIIVVGAVDLGEFVAEELGLSLDPYPRKPGVRFESDTGARFASSSPFGDLARLKPRG